MDTTIVSVALPTIGDDLDASVSGLQWVAAGYTVTLASLLLFGGAAADRWGRVRVFRIGLALFTVGSVLCSAAPSLRWLVAGRIIQGWGGSMMNPVALSIIRVTFDDPRERARAIGLWASAVGIGMALGPVVGGPLSEVDWRAVFLVNVPVGCAAILLTTRYIPESRARQPRRADPVGQILVLVWLTALTVALIEGPALGWTSASMLLLAGLSVALPPVFVAYESRRREPLVDPRFFHSRPFSAASAIAVIAFAAFGGFLFLNSLYLQDVRGLSPAVAGAAVLPIAAATVVASPVSGRLVASRGVRLPLVIGGLAIAGACLVLLSLSADTSTGLLLAAYALFGLGFGAVNPPITNTAVSGMPAAQAGVAAAVASTSRQVGQTLGVAAVGVMLAASGGLSHHATSAMHPVLWSMAGASLLIVVLGLVASTPSAVASAARTAARLS